MQRLNEAAKPETEEQRRIRIAQERTKQIGTDLQQKFDVLAARELRAKVQEATRNGHPNKYTGKLG